MLTADDESHSRQRRIVSHAFSDRAIRDQESLIQKYADLLVDRLEEVTSDPSKATADLAQWYSK